VEKLYNEARYRFKEWTKEDYFSSYLNHVEMEQEREIKRIE